MTDGAEIKMFYDGIGRLGCVRAKKYLFCKMICDDEAIFLKHLRVRTKCRAATSRWSGVVAFYVLTERENRRIVLVVGFV